MAVMIRWCTLLFVCSSVLTFSTHQAPTTNDGNPAEYELILQQEDKDGNIKTERKKITVWAVEDFWSEYRDWEIIDQNQSRIILRKSHKRS
ncbi:BofC N-terminal domain-containing protein [Alteribacillus iranensis]|uniref:Bypass of Forespore C, N terminal n=1 Tax=Alteribacillus iranensis TaxID=930128 RepID=A0A1I1Z5Q6_9BACI|nr:BofC N-terminal domain-containing protein [Alteribacillus iranensis]SFE27039.1 Bypass of Forespore C, N terminal [Alteribacillus iranensis]